MLARQIALLGFDFVKALVNIKRTKGKSAYKFAADAWLGFNFGARPLVSDIQTAIKSTQSYFDRSDHSFRLSASAKRSWISASATSVDETFSYHASLRTNSELYHRLSYRYYAGGVLNVKTDTDYSLREHLGLTKDSLLPALWELTAYSWAVDYFANIGALLDDAFWALPGNLHYSGYTRKYSCTIVIRPRLVLTGQYNSSAVLTHGLFERNEFERVPMGLSLQHIGLHVKSVDQIGKNAVNKLLNLASVLIQRH